MAGIRFAEGLQVVPLYTPVAGYQDAESRFVKLENMQWLSFIVHLGALAESTATVLLTVKTTAGSTDTSTASDDVAIPFFYRLSAAVGSDDWGTITEVSTGTDGVSITAAYDGMLLLIDVDPSVIPSKDADAASLYIDLDHTMETTDSFLQGIVGIFEPRYPQVEQRSSTAGAV